MLEEDRMPVQRCRQFDAGKGEEERGQAKDREARDEDAAGRQLPGKGAPEEMPQPDVGGATGLGTQLSSVAGPTLQVRAINNGVK